MLSEDLSHDRTGGPRDPIVIPRGGHAPSGAPSEIAGLEILAHLLDSAFQIPGLNIRFGLDALLGVIPGLGDVGTSLLSLAILTEARRRGVSKFTMTRMTANVALDAAVGTIPLLGDAFDVYWKANERNVALLKRHASEDPNHRRRAEWSDRLFFSMLILVVVGCLVASLTVAFLTIRWIVGLATG
jgi:hypothetical protein